MDRSGRRARAVSDAIHPSALVDPRAASKITQGITTEVTGEGESIAPLDDRLIAENADTYKRYGVFPTWRTLDGYFRELSFSSATVSSRWLRELSICFEWKRSWLFPSAVSTSRV